MTRVQSPRPHVTSDPLGEFTFDREAIGLLGIVNALLRHWRLLVILPLVVGTIMVAIAFAAGTRYTSTAMFSVESVSQPGSPLSGLASQFGVALPGQGSETPGFYVKLLDTEDVLRPVTIREFGDERGGTAPLADVLEVEGSTAASRDFATIQALREAMSVDADRETGLVRVHVRTRRAALSREIAAATIEELNRFNLGRRQSRAAAERRFAEQRYTEAKTQLTAAEDALKRFLQRNRRYEDSPDLMFQHDQLQREVLMRQQVYTSVAELLERARVDEVRNIPVITVVQQPTLPVWPDRRYLALRLVGGALIGVLIALVVIWMREFGRYQRAHETPEYREFVTTRDRLFRWRRRDSALGRTASDESLTSS